MNIRYRNNIPGPYSVNQLRVILTQQGVTDYRIDRINGRLYASSVNITALNGDSQDIYLNYHANNQLPLIVQGSHVPLHKKRDCHLLYYSDSLALHMMLTEFNPS